MNIETGKAEQACDPGITEHEFNDFDNILTTRDEKSHADTDSCHHMAPQKYFLKLFNFIFDVLELEAQLLQRHPLICWGTLL